MESGEDRKTEYFNGFGGFIEEGREYEIRLEEGNRPPVPWINVIANKNFGFHISESGAGFTWAYNSREYKLTPWSNDPVRDPAAEVIYVIDEITGDIMTPVSLGRTDKGPYLVRHGFGYSTFLHEENGVEQELKVFAPIDEPVKLWQLKLTNHSDKMKYLGLTYYVEWVLGTQREHTNPYIMTTYHNEEEYLSARNIYTFLFKDSQAFLFSSEMITGYTGDRQEFLGRKGSIKEPRGVGRKLSCNTGVGYDSCGAVQVSVAVKPEETKVVLFALGISEDPKEIGRLRNKYRDPAMAEQELNRVKAYWEETLGTVRVSTKDRAVDILVNGWLLYQTISCRINARAAFYQCGGAYGYRDQLQDTLSLNFTDPGALRRQILVACSRQFEEGDVQHWWHPPMGVGVRTRITDDLLWLPYATAVYIKNTGDTSILREMVPYIKGPVLTKEQHEIMFTPENSELTENVYEHCKKTIQITRLGIHGLPLIGGGDWNDGMNEVGIEGKGESVWLAWFFFTLLGEFIPVCSMAGDPEYAEQLKKMREELMKSIEEHTWDGEWYLRAFYDDGSKLGSKECDECRIDSISQSWSVISGGAGKERALTAMNSAWKHLILEEYGISLLLTPPFNKTNKNPGYIKNYLPGVRENGGQYTHAAVWLAIATAMIGNYDMAYKLFTMLNPIHLTKERSTSIRYEKEPYVMVADISPTEPYAGKGGWSWYTGSAGWMYQGLVQWFLGIRKEADNLIIAPATPVNFGDYKVTYRFGSSVYEIHIVSRSKGVTATEELSVDGIKLQGNRVKLVDDGKVHQVIV